MSEAKRVDLSTSDAPSRSGWERAYLDFETPEEARAKIEKRLKRFGADRWERDVAILEMFCGSGPGLEALTRQGFRNVEGMDLSAELIERYRGTARCHVGDCRQLPFPSGSRQVVIVHGGLHHLESLDDIERVLEESRRVLSSGGLFCAVEPWPTPYLTLVRAVARNSLARRTWRKLDAFQSMVENELETYERWLSSSKDVEQLLRASFRPRVFEVRWGSLCFVGESAGSGPEHAATID